MRKSTVLVGCLYTKVVATVGSHRRKVTGSSSTEAATRLRPSGWCSIHETAVEPRECATKQAWGGLGSRGGGFWFAVLGRALTLVMCLCCARGYRTKGL